MTLLICSNCKTGMPEPTPAQILGKDNYRCLHCHRIALRPKKDIDDLILELFNRVEELEQQLRKKW